VGVIHRVPFRQRQLGRTLRELRERTGLTQDQVARAMRCSDSTISRFENGEPPGYHPLRSLLDEYRVTGDQWDAVVAIWERATAKGWWHAFGLDDQGYVSMEDEASLVREYQLGVIPGLLQTEAYARALFSASNEPRSRRRTENDIAVRMRRQDRLMSEPPLELHAIIDESVLHTDIDPATMRHQLRRILDRAELPNVSVRVLRRSAGLHDGRLGSFIVLGFPDRDDPDLAYVEHAFGSVHIEKESQVHAAKVRFDHLWSRADDSLDVLHRVAAKS
jgi:transcriptional regulator with XRE-family HTH domain